jgi:RNA polymerase sigma factor (sigma-70 family)
MGHLTDLAAQEDEYLMQAYARGNERAFMILFERYDQQVMGFLIKRMGYDRSLAEDISQKVWLSLVQSSASYQATAKFRTFIFTIARNRIIDHYRDPKNRIYFDVLDADVCVDVESDRLNPEQAYAQQQESSQIDEAFMQLPDHHRVILTLYYDQEMTAQDIAQMMDIPLERVKSRIRYARQALQNLFKPDSLLQA